MQKLQLNDLLIFPRIYEPLKRWAPNALETLHTQKTFIIILTKMIIGRKQILVPVLVYVSKSDWMLNQLTSKSVPHNDNSPKEVPNKQHFFLYIFYKFDICFSLVVSLSFMYCSHNIQLSKGKIRSLGSILYLSIMVCEI